MSSPQYRYLMPEQLEVGPVDLGRAAQFLRERTGILLGTHKHEMAGRTLDRRARKLGVERLRPPTVGKLAERPASSEETPA